MNRSACGIVFRSLAIPLKASRADSDTAVATATMITVDAVKNRHQRPGDLTTGSSSGGQVAGPLWRFLTASTVIIVAVATAVSLSALLAFNGIASDLNTILTPSGSLIRSSRASRRRS